MFGHSMFERTLYMGKKSLDTAMVRKTVIANNIANVDTPRYKRHTVSFESELNRALKQNQKSSFELATVHKRHIPLQRKRSLEEVSPRVHVEWNTNIRNDENNVDIEKEISDEVKNTLHYQAVTSAIANSFKRLKSAIV